MIIDDLKAFGRYLGLNPLFPAVAEFLRTTDLNSLPTGITKIQGDDLFINVHFLFCFGLIIFFVIFFLILF